MAQFWSVNHNQTARQEIDGQHFWSPKTESNGARNEFYYNMRRATPGDPVLSYTDQAIDYMRRIAEFAFTARKPIKFGEALLESRAMTSADLLDTAFPFDPSQNNNRESRPAPAEAIFANPSSFGLRQSESYLTGIPQK
ncbi:hypothetical protein NKJ70_11870 [Mesorhizobium sp. M0092]|uniref:hypothetical protein n=1 Tax=Mesorhizobium sp. M0092 TaxID=2956876 RepID=UPI003339438F